MLTEGAKGMRGAIEKADELASTMEGAIVLGQFVNPANPKAHMETTGPEIWEDTDGKIDILVAGVGTGGTITGTGAYLKGKNPDIRIVAVEPSDSPVLSGGVPGPHGLQGIGAGFVPDILDTEIYDEIVKVETPDAYAASRKLAFFTGDFDRHQLRCCPSRCHGSCKTAGKSGKDYCGGASLTRERDICPLPLFEESSGVLIS